MPHKKADPLDDTETGPVPNFQPNPVPPEPGRDPIPNPQRPGNGVTVPPERAPFPGYKPDEPDRRPM